MINYTTKKVITFAIVFLISGYYLFFAKKYSSPETHFQIEDAVSGKPISGVIVIINWPIVGSHNSSKGSIALFESESDRNGDIHFPKWGPIKTPYGGQLHYAAPIVSFFKQGYQYKEVDNYVYPAGSKQKPKTTSIWNNKKIKLEVFDGNDQEYTLHVEEFQRVLFRIPRKCLAETVPKTIFLIDQMKQYFESKEINNSLVAKDDWPECHE